MRYEVKSMGLWAFLKVSFFLNLIGGFLFGFFYAVLLMFSTGLLASLGLPREELMLFEEGGGIGLMFIILPIMFSLMAAALYTLAGVIFVLLYNVIARLVGGFELDLQPVDMTPVPTEESGPMYAQTAPAAPPPPPLPSSTPPPEDGTPPQPT